MFKLVVLVGLFLTGSLCAQQYQVPAEVLAALVEEKPGQLIAMFQGEDEGVVREALQYWYRATNGMRSKQKLNLIKESLDYMAAHRKQQQGWSTMSVVGIAVLTGGVGVLAGILLIASQLHPIYR